MRRRYKSRHNSNHEFELDLAPLLAVMVKLVPVLLLSSAFVQISTLETDLPQVVKAALENPPPENKTVVSLNADSLKGFSIKVLKNGEIRELNVAKKGDAFDFQALHLALRSVKTENPEVFRLEFNPDETMTQADIVRVMDEARKSRDKNIAFPVFDKANNKQVQTDYMFPDVTFANLMEG
jgi:biopolymer transport protein ExbD